MPLCVLRVNILTVPQVHALDSGHVPVVSAEQQHSYLLVILDYELFDQDIPLGRVQLSIYNRAKDFRAPLLVYDFQFPGVHISILKCGVSLLLGANLLNLHLIDFSTDVDVRQFLVEPFAGQVLEVGVVHLEWVTQVVKFKFG